MPKNKTFQLRPKADDDLENIYEYSYQEFRSARAENYINDLDDAFHTLADKPGSGNDYGHIRPGLKAYRVVSHVIFFRPSVNGVTILRALHKSMDFGRHL